MNNMPEPPSRLQIKRIVSNTKNIRSAGFTKLGNGALGLRGKEVRLLDYAHQSMTMIDKDLRSKGFDAKEREKVKSLIGGRADNYSANNGSKASDVKPNFLSAVGEYERKQIIDKALKSDFYYKNARRLYDASFVDMVEARRKRLAKVTEVSIRTKISDDAKKTLADVKADRKKMDDQANSLGLKTKSQTVDSSPNQNLQTGQAENYQDGNQLGQADNYPGNSQLFGS